ncbi:hypothetical protein MBLNU459_g1048t1 [Dothideomycetes sp. NU459]
MDHKTHNRFLRYPDTTTLVFVFVLWKTLLLCVACASPGPGYDTSTQLLIPTASSKDAFVIRVLSHVAHKLVRWDSVFFVNIADRGYLFEQEWAFGWGFTRLVSFAAKVVYLPAEASSLLVQTIAGSVIAHTAHLLSVLVLRALAWHILLPLEEVRRSRIAFVTAFLHVFSPAGLFLAAPAPESTFSLLNFLGMLFYAKGYAQRLDIRNQILFFVYTIGSGVCFGLASTVRGNGLLSSVIFVPHGIMLMSSALSLDGFFALLATGLAAVFTACGTLIPQFIAYQSYCPRGDSGRIWCSHMPPSIYAFVQKHYWNNGFLQYWTMSNLPLFLLAMPMIVVLLFTGLLALLSPELLLSPSPPSDAQDAKITGEILLAGLDLTNFHVQIINRISTGYPIWYLVIAIMTTSRALPAGKQTPSGTQDAASEYLQVLLRSLSKGSTQQWLLRSMIMYALVQGGLYASFLPPA